ncbi:hypothetical protein CVV68_13405 [Arthrobacter livingstonensis]|uniref:Uncharacterized protein n=1 Tax=Arthrobacter livingstonensis TaxID=670078 RepID=A0A2V5L789_9MICC|nr:hypothetical protein [Arthrobacter livingstonensis]PYI66562.1 hypothetical protein CVV68_13405 [Arthrobacter livingstonensis]
MDIDVQIERLVLDGLELGPGGADALAAALEAELSRSLAATGAGLRAGSPSVPDAAGPAFGSTGRLVLPPVAVTAGMQPGLLGRRIGATLAGGLNHG